MAKHIDLSHDITAGMVTYLGLPAPQIEDHLSREAAEEIYGPGLTFQIGLVTLCTNTGTYIDVPFHRYADGHDLIGLALERVAAVDAMCVDKVGVAAIDLADVDLADARGRAVLIHTGHSSHWGTDTYFVDHPFLTEEATNRLIAAGVACAGIDSLNIEHLDNLSELPARGFRFTAVPPKIEGCGTFTARADASIT